jgi:hypothetical protein
MKKPHTHTLLCLQKKKKKKKQQPAAGSRLDEKTLTEVRARSTF